MGVAYMGAVLEDVRGRYGLALGGAVSALMAVAQVEVHGSIVTRNSPDTARVSGEFLSEIYFLFLAGVASAGGSGSAVLGLPAPGRLILSTTQTVMVAVPFSLLMSLRTVLLRARPAF